MENTKPEAQTKETTGDLAMFLLEKTGSVFGIWRGYMSKKDQLHRLGLYLGKGKIIIDGADETVCCRVKVCFGMDYEDKNTTRWANLPLAV